jgi:glycosyltransferase involved in cell wall biosynthesis
VLIAAEWYPPAYRAGGPVRSVANTASLLAATHDVHVVAGAYDLGEHSPMPGVTLGSWCDDDSTAGGLRTLFLTRDRWQLRTWDALMTELRPDLLYLNSLFSRRFTFDPLRAAGSWPRTRVVLAPRGMLSPGALASKPIRKRAFLAAVRRLGIFGRLRWHAATQAEAADVRHYFPNAEVCVARDLVVACRSGIVSRPGDTWRLLALGRIHPVKNLSFGLRALAAARSARPVMVDVVGPEQDDHCMRELRSLAAAAPHISVQFHGARSPAEVEGFLRNAHYLLSPTLQESFGHSIVEAWAHGLPVLISDRTPWRGLEKLGIGWDWPLELDTWRQGLERALGLDHAHWQRLAENAQRFYRYEVCSETVRSETLRVFSP